MDRLHTNEFALDLSLARRLVDEACPQYAGLALRPCESTGSSNLNFRLGETLLVRLPRQPGGGAQIVKEARWSGMLAKHLPVAVPIVRFLGEPLQRYPEPWSILEWLPGAHPPLWTEATVGEAGRREGSLQLAQSLADLILALRSMAVDSQAQADPALKGLYRGGPLQAYDKAMQEQLLECRALPGLDLDYDRILAIWNDALVRQKVQESPRSWFHGDLLSENLLINVVDHKQSHANQLTPVLTGLLDLGGLGIGDPSIDLICAWEMLGPEARERFKTRMDVSDAQWSAGKAWALAVAVMTFPYYWHSMPERIQSRLAMVNAVLSDPL